MSAVFLLNRRYAPFYKWTHRALRQLPVLGPATARLLENLVAAGPAAKEALVEEVCRLVVGELNRQGLSDKRNDFLLEQALEVQNGIKDETIRALSVFIG